MAFDRCYSSNLFRASQLYPGVVATLEALTAAGLTLGCVTNKREIYARALLQQAGIEAPLRFIYGGDTFAAKKPDPKPLLMAAAEFGVKPDQCVMIGDSFNDCAAAKAAGFGFIFARYGYSAADDPVLNNGLAAINSFADMRELLCRE